MSQSDRNNSNLRRTWKSLENLNKVAMEVQENSNGRGRRSNNISRRRTSTESSDETTNDEYTQKDDLEFVARAVEKLDDAFTRIDRYGHGVPCIRPVRELCGKLRLQLNNEHGAFNRTLEELARASVPGHKAIIESVDELRNAVNCIAHDETDYISRMEDVKQYLGELSGIVKTVLHLGYQNI